MLRWTGKNRTDGPEVAPDASDAPPRRNTPMLSWSQSPALEAILRALEDAQRAIEEVKRYLDERLTPFQKYLADQGRSVDQALRQLDTRIRPLKQYLQGQEQNLERVSAHL